MNIRQATLDDVEFLVSAWLHANYERLAMRPDWDEKRFVEGFRQQTIDEVEGREIDSVTYVVEEGGMQLGRLRLVRSTDEISIAALQIAPEYQSRGVGTELLHLLISEAEAAESKLTLEVEKDNPRAKELYLRLGFEVLEDRSDREFMVRRGST